MIVPSRLTAPSHGTDPNSIPVIRAGCKKIHTLSIGVAGGVGLAQLISGIMKIPVAISVPAIVIAVVFSTLIGVIFGLLPASKAANMSPIEALRRN